MAPVTRSRTQNTETPNPQNTEPELESIEIDLLEDTHTTPKTTIATSTSTMADQQLQEQTELQQLCAVVAALQAQLAAPRAAAPRAARETSVFNDKEEEFEPQGHAAWDEFAPFPGLVNPEYSDRARSRHVDPQTFDGKTVKFERWVLEVANKLRIDSPTFRTEDARIAYIARFLEGPPSDVVQPRLRSKTRPLTSVAETIQLLQTAYADANIASRADRELQAMTFEWKEPISLFIAQFSAKAEEAGIARSLLKNKLWDKLPKSIRVNTVNERRNQCTYEHFCTQVIDIAYALEPSQDEKKPQQQKGFKAKPTKTTTTTAATTTITNDSGRPRKLNAEERTVLMARGACFRCRQDGHLSKDCPKYGTTTAPTKKVDEVNLDIGAYSSDEESSKE
jgi:hypothetical protein